MPDIEDDPQIEQLSRSLNAMLNAMERQRKQGAAATIKAQEEERKRIARELHDETSQSLTGLVLGISVVEEMLDGSCDEIKVRLSGIKDLANETLNEVHTMAVRLRPTVLDDLGLVAALRSYAREFTKKTSIDVDLNMPRTSQRLDAELETVIYRVVQEALTNVARHSGADYCSVKLESRDDIIYGTIADNGRGFDPRLIMMSGNGAGLGLHGMKERIELVRGSIYFDSIPDHGSTIHIKVPVEPGEGIA
jgi:two-component system sensor histidine kinase UhpB